MLGQCALGVRGYPHCFLKQLQQLHDFIQIGLLNSLGEIFCVVLVYFGVLLRLLLLEATHFLQMRHKDFKHHFLQNLGGFGLSDLLFIADKLREDYFGHLECRLAQPG